MYFLSNLENEISFYQVGLILKYALNIVFIIVPIIVMIMCMIDISKHIVKPDSPGPTIKMLVSRIIAGLIIFLIPTMLNAIFTLIEGYDDSAVTKYYTEASVEKIEQLKTEVENEKKANKNKTKAELKEAALKREEEERKKNEQLEAIRKENEQNNNSSDSPGNYDGDSTSGGEFGSVTVKDGVFYIPNRRATSDSDIPKQSGGYGVNPIFWERLNALLTDAKAQGYNVTVTSGWRSYSSQRSLWDNSNRACSERSKWVACPGGSRHGFGIAADLSFNGTSCSGGWDCNNAAKWVHANAANYGLKFRMSWEPWHIEPAQVQGGNFGSCKASC